MRDIAVGFLWHMHQPFYKDPATGTYLMPWVRLHSIRGYYDMIRILEEFPDIKSTFNLVPSLIKQLIDYTDNGLRDTEFHLSEKMPSELSNDEKKHILSCFFMCNRHTMIDPLPRYVNLLEKRGDIHSPTGLDEAVRRFSNQDMLDLQVLFNLAWTGFMVRKDSGIAELLRKGRNFNTDEKMYVLSMHLAIMREIIPLYKKALDEGRIDITTTPFYHPIAPLLINVGFSLRCMNIPLPKEPFSHPEDLERQVEKAIEFHTEVFGRAPSGMWPAEGSVCPEMIDIIARHGIKWTATDEDILFASLRQSRTGERLHRPYRVEYNSSSSIMFFRDRALADNIGFVYSKNPPGQAVNDFMHHLENIRKGSRAYDFKPFVSIILDGENPWEYYPDGGEAFLRGLYSRLSSSNEINTELFSTFAKENKVAKSITNLYTGSWINHNFAIWIGHEEDRKGWEYVARTRRYVESKKDKANPLAWEEIYIAEGSDWYWWYGDEFSTDNDEEFDRLFRLHLKNCYTLHNEPPPDYLSTSIITPHDITPLRKPSGFIYPAIDGKVTHYYEWIKSGLYATSTGSSSMYQSKPMIDRIYYGFDLTHLFMRMDFSRPPADSEICLNIVAPREMVLTISTRERTMKLIQPQDKEHEELEEPYELALGSILEIKLPFVSLSARPGQRIRFHVSVLKKRMETERHPASGLLFFTVPDTGFERIMWHV